MKEKQEVLLGEAGDCPAGRGRSELRTLLASVVSLPLEGKFSHRPSAASEPSFHAAIRDQASNFHFLLPNGLDF